MGVRSLRPVIGRRLLRTHSLSIRLDIEVRQTPGAHIWRRSAAWAKPSPLGQLWSVPVSPRHQSASEGEARGRQDLSGAL